MDIRKLSWLTFFLLAVSLSCNFLLGAKSGPTPGAISTPAVRIPTPTDASEFSEEPAFSALSFCVDVSDAGECIQPGDSFDSGVHAIWAYFTYQNMQDGMTWGRLWKQDGEIYIDSRDLSWEDGESGWLAYSISDDEGPLQGRYSLTLYMDGDPVQEGAFEIEPAAPPSQSGFAAFGPITFGAGITAAKTAVDVNSQFEQGITQVYASFPYQNIGPEQVWGKAWFQNGETVGESEDVWGTPMDGAVAAYRRDTSMCYLEPHQRPPGTVLVSRPEYNQKSWEEVAATIAHELTHAYQHLSGNGRCETCSVQKEYEAFHVYINALYEMGRVDIAQAQYPGVVTDNGYVDGDLLWYAIKETYTGCPDY